MSMSMSTHIIGLRDPNNSEHLKKVNACQALFDVGIDDLPAELKEYFNDCFETGEVRDHSGIEVEIKENPAVQKLREDMQDGFIVDIRKLPAGVTHIKFYNSY